MPSLFSDLWTDACRAAAGLIFVEACALCAQSTAGSAGSAVPGLCHSCLQSLPRLGEPRCRVCGEWFMGNIPGPFQCANCTGRKFAFEFATAPFKARRGMRDMVHRFKYQRELWLGETLGRLLATALHGPTADERLAASDQWLLVPVPLHPRRLRDREFNQALELAAVTSRHTGCAVADVLRRTRYTSGQAAMTRHQRLHNLRGAFRLRRPLPWRPTAESMVAGRRLLVVDDVFTTGATAQECARILLKYGGARQVAVLTLTRG